MLPLAPTIQINEIPQSINSTLTYSSGDFAGGRIPQHLEEQGSWSDC